MNIRQAAAQIEAAMRAYSSRTPDGRYRIARQAQRPLYLVGPPGVGKTEAVAQAARRMGVGYAAYTMTHHTRQTALGLPMIAHRTVGGRERAVTEYTMSEIVSEVWARADAGAERGILFLDEINCVSEALMPAMLQLLQYKTFGVHALPRGWMIVCAGNPPRYNRYARTFDAVVLDRLRVIEVEPDLAAWRAYAAERHTHPSVRSYLAMRPDDFYRSDGDRVVTARSWSDLSDAMLALEAEGIAPDEALFGQYLQVEDVARDFALYHGLCAGFGAQLDGVLSGQTVRMEGAGFDEALFAALMLSGRLRAVAADAAEARRLAERLSNFADGVARQAGDPAEACAAQLSRLENALEVRIRMNAIDEADIARERQVIDAVRKAAAGQADVLSALRARAAQAQTPAAAMGEALDRSLAHALDFVKTGIDDPNVRMLFLNELQQGEALRAWIHGHCADRFEAMRRACDPEARAVALRASEAP